MASKLVLTLLIVGLIAPQITNAQLLCALLGVGCTTTTTTIKPTTTTRATTTTTTAPTPTPAPQNDNCSLLKDGARYRLQSFTGQWAISSQITSEIWMREATEISATKFTVVKKGCNTYSFCFDALCIRRCEECAPENQNQIHMGADNVWSQFELAYFESSAPYYFIKAKDYMGLWTCGQPNADNDSLVTLSNLLSDGAKFTITEVV